MGQTITPTTRQQVQQMAAEMGWTVYTLESVDIYWVDRTAQGKDWSDQAIPTKWTSTGELVTVWLDGVETDVNDFTCDGQHTVEYLMAFVLDLNLAAEGKQ